MRREVLMCMLLAAALFAGKLLITGSSTMAPMVEELGKRFRARHPGAAIVVEAGGAGRGVADALEGEADIGMASRGLNPKEKALFAIPIARADLAKLFKPLAQLDAGLARRPAELHGGTIEVESEPGKGSTFTLRFPIHEKS